MAAPAPSQRIASIDQFRGLTILAMVLVNYLSRVQIAPAWLKHAQDIGLTAADLVAPCFIFAIGLTYSHSFHRRAERDGLKAAYLHFIQRYFVLIGIGTIFSAGESLVGLSSVSNHWGVLEAIGTAGLLSLCVVRLPLPAIFAAGLGLLGAYQLLLERFWLSTVLNSAHGGILGALSWSAMLMLSIGLAGLFHQPRTRYRLYPLLGAATAAAGMLLSILSPISKNRVSAAYVLVSLGFAALLYLFMHLLADRLKIISRLLGLWGRNPLALYILHMLLLGLFALPPVPGWYQQAPLWLVILQVLALVGLLTVSADTLKRRGWVLAL